ncbi:hypothetical protein F511_03480 [Dorcoceras hygrometricum]|uniref:Retrotransposon gag domain-containing protein n=1 Tax=Dorcoceras hygrometricum TaxID=472368 RepID=A0A2Z7DEI3_9LAMI|nr:hypothetical protein F511_03480 [Dorcoceras hygrometricum]
MTVREYASKFSALLAYVPHVAGRETAKSTRFVEGLNEELYQSVLTSKPKMYAEAVDSSINIEEGMRSCRTRRAQVAQAVQSGRFVGQGLSRLRVPSLAISPSSSRWLSSPAAKGFDPAVSNSRNSLVLALLVLVV